MSDSDYDSDISGDDMPPPLEDMTAHLVALKMRRDRLDETSHNVGFSTTAQYTSDSSSTTTPIAPTPTTLAEPVLKTKKVLKKKKKKQKNQGLFGGLRGGFFNSKPKKKKSKESTKPSPKPTSTSAPTKPSGQDMATAAADGSIPFIRARKPSGGKTGINNITSSSDNPYMIPEVQSAMKDSLVNGAKEWVNKDLMTKITGDTTMMAAFQDPRLAPAMQEFTTDPQKALNKYKDNKEVMSFMQKFMGLMGGHFSDMAGKQQGRSSENKDSSNSGNSGDGSGNRVRKDESSAMGMGRGRGGGGDILTPAAASRQAAPLMTKRDPYHGNSGEYVDFNGKQVDKMTLQKWMSDPQIVSILNHPRTSMMLSEIGKDRTKFAKYARTPTILTLVRAGILDVPPEYAGMVNY